VKEQRGARKGEGRREEKASGCANKENRKMRKNKYGRGRRETESENEEREREPDSRVGDVKERKRGRARGVEEAREAE
jgi:hypothetical protein